MDFTHVTLPQWFTSAIGLFVLAIAWRVGGVWLDQKVKRFGEKRRVGQRSSDDAHSLNPFNGGLDRLIKAIESNADSNIKIAKSLAIISGRQDLILESTRLLQIEEAQTQKIATDILGFVNT